jgi:hypothetical protein
VSTWFGFYVRDTSEAATHAIQDAFSDSNTEIGEEFVQVIPNDEGYIPNPDRMTKLSLKLDTDVVWLSFQSTVDGFEFHRWSAGQLFRSLVYGVYEHERTWEEVCGQPEPWERDAFFGDKSLQLELELAQSEDEKEELSRIWKDSELLPGRTQPSIDAGECAWKVVHYYGFHGWD